MPTLSGHTTAIRGTRVIGADVCNSEGEKIGRVEDLVLDKTDNRIMFAVVGFGGLMGVGEKFHPIPWAVLDFSPEHNAYVVPYTKEQLESAPSDTIEELTRDDGHAIRDHVFSYYSVEGYWN